jgi:hypothetical protein
MTTTPLFSSALAPLLERYVNLKRSLGRRNWPCLSVSRNILIEARRTRERLPLFPEVRSAKYGRMVSALTAANNRLRSSRYTEKRSHS